MAEYLVRRLLIAIPTMFVIVTLSFLLIRAAPGGPFDEEAALEPQVIENLSAAYHLDKPVSTQFVIYLGNVLQGDLGPSMIYKDFTVNELLRSSRQRKPRAEGPGTGGAAGRLSRHCGRVEPESGA